MMNLLERNIDKIFIIFNNQNITPISKKSSVKINTDIYDFIEQILKQQKNKINIRFSNIDSVIYWDIIKEIVEHFENNNQVEFSCSTTGSFITQEIADFMNVYNFSVTISLDDVPISLIQQRYDIFSNKKKKDILYSLSKLGLSTKFTSFISPLNIIDYFQSIDNEYIDIWDYHLHMDMNDFFNIENNDIKKDINYDYNIIRNDMEFMARTYLNNIVHPVDNDVFNKMLYLRSFVIDYIINNLCDFVENNDSKFCFANYNNLNTLTIDIFGNLYSYNNFNIIGNIGDSYFTYLKNFLNIEKTFEFYKNICSNCNIYSICHSNSKFINVFVDKKYCELRKSILEPVLNTFIQFGKINCN